NGIASTAPGGGYELTLGLAALAFVVAILGTGRFSLDVVLRRFLMRPAASRAASADAGPSRQSG
ncbi:MAG TPA: hypothetical protein VKQ71_05670, partial [Acidimicrobiales bacterium]|nr:hypothetical protein [Acidimicrobiales bacterium]